jgi:hypothetical protein
MDSPDVPLVPASPEVLAEPAPPEDPLYPYNSTVQELYVPTPDCCTTVISNVPVFAIYDTTLPITNVLGLPTAVTLTKSFATNLRLVCTLKIAIVLS